MPSADLLGQVPDARGDLVADEGHQQRDRTPMPTTTTSSAASLRGRPSRCSHATSGLARAAMSRAIDDRQHHDEEELEQPQDDRAPARADDEEPPGPGRSEVHAVGHLGRLEVRGPADDLRLDLHRPAGCRAPRPTAGRSAPRSSGLVARPAGRRDRERARQSLISCRGSPSHVDRLRASAAAAAGRRSDEQADRCEHVVAVDHDPRVLRQLPAVGRDAGSPPRMRPATPGRSAAARRPSPRAGRPRGGPCRCARRPGRPGRPRPASDRRGGAARGWPRPRRSARPRGARRRSSGRKDGSAVRRTAAGARSSRAAASARLPRAQRAPAHAEVTLDGPGHRRRRHHLAREAGVLRDRAAPRSARRWSPRRCRRPRHRPAASAASTSTPVSTRSGVAPRTIAVKSARELSPLPPITCSRNISRIARRAGSGASTPIRGTTLSVTTTGQTVQHSTRPPAAPRRCRRRRPAHASRSPRAARAPRRMPSSSPPSVPPVSSTTSGRVVRARSAKAAVRGGPAEHGDHLAAAGERDPAAGLGGDQLLVADDRDPQSTTGRGAGQHLGVRRRGVLSSELGTAGVDPVEHVRARSVVPVAGGRRAAHRSPRRRAPPW